VTALDVEALLLDLDGTLVDSTPAVVRAWRAAADRLGLPFDRLAPHVHGVPADAVLRAAAPHLTPTERAAEAEQVLAEQSAPEAAVAALPGALELLASVPAHRVAVVTSGSLRLVTASAAKAGLTLPAVLVTADDVVHGKPDPEPYLRAATALGVDPADCLVVEDAPAGVAAGRAAGARVLGLLTTHTAAELAGATHVVRDLRDVRVEHRPGGLRVVLAPASLR
jgi:sugar-phosphatase